MILRIDHSSQEPIYLQIRTQIVGAIARGELTPGDGLPSVRALASDLGVNLHTVNKAYAVLRDEGYLLMRGRSGAYVADYQQHATPEHRAAQSTRMAEALYQLALEHCAQGGSRESFLAVAEEQAARAYNDPGIAGERRSVNVLGLDQHGKRLRKNASKVNGAAGAAAATLSADPAR